MARPAAVLERQASWLAPPGEDRRQLVRRDDLELVEGAVARLLVGTPPAELRRVTEPAALHVVVGDLDHQLRPQRLPGKIFPLAPAAHRSGHPPRAGAGLVSAPLFPGVFLERALAIGRHELHQLAPLLVREARAHAYMLELAAVIEEPQQQRSHRSALPALVPAKAGDHAVALPLVLDLEH